LSDSIIINEVQPSIVISSIAQGAKGSPGTPGGFITTVIPVTMTSINGLTVVAVNETGLIVADSTDPTAVNVIGITRNSAIQGELITIACSGGTVLGFAGLEVGKTYYASVSGTITSTLPTTGFLIPVGKAIATTELLVNLTGIIQLTEVI